jgi:sulfur carrier protein ThiS
MLTVTVHLHTILQRPTPQGLQRVLPVELPEKATMNDLLELLEIELPREALLLAVNGRIVDTDRHLTDGDQVRVMPAMSGG